MKNSIKQNNEISEREIQALIRQSLDQVQVYDEFSTDTSEISGTYFLLPDGRILREYHELNASEASYTFVNYIPEEQNLNSCASPVEEEEASFWTGMKKLGQTSVDVVKGTGTGLYRVGEDLVTGVVDVVTNPIDTFNSTVEAVRNYDQTYHAIKSAISESYERDVINGDAYSRANWFSYATGTIATSIVGTKGLGAVGKTGVATTKSAAQTGISATKNAFQSSSIANLLPYTPRPQLAMAEDVPFNTLNGVELKDQLISMAKVESVGKGIDKPKTRVPRTNGKWEGEPGNGKWYSEKPEVKNITNGEGVEFINGRPNFTPWSEGDILFGKGELTGTNNDFSLVYEKIQQQYDLPSKNAAKKLLKQAGVTPHHKSSTVIELIPTDLHGNVPHIGSASDLRGGY